MNIVNDCEKGHGLLAVTIPSTKVIAKIILGTFTDSHYIVSVGREAMREHIFSMREDDFIIREYEDKNKAIASPVQAIGNVLLNLNLYSFAEQFWKQINQEILFFNNVTGRRVNRGIPLGNIGVAQLAQGKTIEGLSSIYSAYDDDRECLQHISGIKIDAEVEVAKSPLYTQFENHTVGILYDEIVLKCKTVFKRGISKNDFTAFLAGLNPDRKLLLYTILYRFMSALASDRTHTSFISRAELLRSLADLAVWFEYELKKKTKHKSGTLFEILANRIRKKYKVELNSKKGEYNKVSTLDELHRKISYAITTSDPLQVRNARITGCVRNFVGHNLEVTTHTFFRTCDEVFARMLSLMIFAKGQKWIKTS